MKSKVVKCILLTSFIVLLPSTFVFASEITGFLGQGEQGLQAQVAQLSAEVGEIPRGGGGYIPPAEPTTITPGDINGDNKVDKYDLALMMAAWGKTGTNNSDLNGDGKVDKYDFSLLMAYWTVA